MTVPDPPIIALSGPGDRVGAFLTKVEAVGHMVSHGASGSDTEFFDSSGRRLSARVRDGGLLEDLEVACDDDHSEEVRERVRRRAQVVREKMDQLRGRFTHVDDSPLTLAFQDVPFERFAWLLASALRPQGSPSDPVDPLGHSAGWWHNMFGH